jgi:hypothetical protein
VTDLRRWENMVTWLEHVPKTLERLGLNRNQTMAVGLKGQGGLIMRILRRTLMILVMVVLRMRP